MDQSNKKRFSLFPLQIVLKRVRLCAVLNTTLATLCLPPLSRNYHVFYYLLAGASEEERKTFHLLKPEEYHYLNQVGSPPHTHTRNQDVVWVYSCVCVCILWSHVIARELFRLQVRLMVARLLDVCLALQFLNGARLNTSGC